DFIGHQVEILLSDGTQKALLLAPMSVAAFHDKLMSTLRSLGVEVSINEKPQEVADAIPFVKDERHCSYDGEYAHRWWRIQLSTETVLSEFRSRFVGKCSPAH